MTGAHVRPPLSASPTALPASRIRVRGLRTSYTNSTVDPIQQESSSFGSHRRRVVSSRVRSTEDQLPPRPGSAEADLLQRLYAFFDGRKHAFELLAAQVSAQTLGGSGARYHDGWLTRPGGDGGVDFVGRIDVGAPANNTPLVVLGQANCITPTSSISPDQVARVVARLRRGWIGVFVTTGTFTRQAQIEVIDDQYPLVHIDGKTLAEQLLRTAAANHDGDVNAYSHRSPAGTTLQSPTVGRTKFCSDDGKLLDRCMTPNASGGGYRSRPGGHVRCTTPQTMARLRHPLRPARHPHHQAILDLAETLDCLRCAADDTLQDPPNRP